MPQIFRVGSYIVYFWANEGEPLVLTSGFLSSGKYIISANVPT